MEVKRGENVAHFANGAAKDCSKLVIFHLVASPTSEARYLQLCGHAGIFFCLEIAETRRRASLTLQGDDGLSFHSAIHLASSRGIGQGADGVFSGQEQIVDTVLEFLHAAPSPQSPLPRWGRGRRRVTRLDGGDDGGGHFGGADFAGVGFGGAEDVAGAVALGDGGGDGGFRDGGGGSRCG